MGDRLSQALADKDFLAAPAADQKGYLSSIDKDFAKASSADQDAYLKHILPAPTTNVGGTSMNLRTGEGGIEAATAQAAKPKTAMEPIRQMGQGLYSDSGGKPLTPDQQRRSNIVGYSTLGAFAAPYALPEIVSGLGTVAAGSGMAGLGAGAGTMAGQKASGENPLTPINLKEAGTNAGITALTGMGLGTLGLAGEGMGLGNLKVLGGQGLRSAMYTPEGELSPALEEATSHPLKALGRGVLKAVVPPPAPALPTVDVPGGTGAPLPEAREFYENAGKERVDIMNRTRRQEALDRAAASRAAKNAPKPAPPSFGQGMTSTANPGGANLELPTVPEGPTPEPPARIVTGTEKPQKSLIVRPDEPEPAVRRTMQSQPREVLARLAAKGDPAAIAELRRNPGRVDVDAIPNLRYIGVRPLIQ